MQLSKSYTLLKYLNRKHHRLERNFLAAIGWVGTLVCTRSKVLATGISKDFRDDRFDLAFRKAARHARLFWPKLELIHIPFFDFTLNTTVAEREIMANKVRKIELKERKLDQLTDLLYIVAKDIHFGIAQGICVNGLMDEFYTNANQALKILPKVSPGSPKSSNGITGDFQKQDAVLALQEISEILPLTKWPWFIMSGTFLGQHREGGFLKHDYDIDLGIHAEDIDLAELMQLLKSQSKFAIQKVDTSIEVLRDKNGQPSLDERVSIIKIIHSNGIPIDIFIHYTQNNICWHGSVIHRWENSPFGLVRTELEGVSVNSPDNPDIYLSENYGDWKTPVTDFDCTTGTPNLTFSRNFKSLALCIKRLAYYSAHDNQQAKKLLNTLLNTHVLNRNLGDEDKDQLSLELKL